MPCCCWILAFVSSLLASSSEVKLLQDVVFPAWGTRSLSKPGTNPWPRRNPREVDVGTLEAVAPVHYDDTKKIRNVAPAHGRFSERRASCRVARSGPLRGFAC